MGSTGNWRLCLQPRSVFLLLLLLMTSAQRLGGHPTLGEHGNSLDGSSGLRIVDGIEAEPHSLPFTVSLQLKGRGHFCGGSLIAPNYVLTAAHCIEDLRPEDFLVVAGEHDLSRDEGTEMVRAVHHFYIHEGFNRSAYVNDICLIKLDKGFVPNKNVDIIDLPEPDTKPFGSVRLAGWGQTRFEPLSAVLMTIDNFIMPDEDCRDFFPVLVESCICAVSMSIEETGHSTCRGDSGGPMVWNGTLIGIVSYGGNHCGMYQLYPSAQTEVSYFIGWIQNLIKYDEEAQIGD